MPTMMVDTTTVAMPGDSGRLSSGRTINGPVAVFSAFNEELSLQVEKLTDLFRKFAIHSHELNYVPTGPDFAGRR